MYVHFYKGIRCVSVCSGTHLYSPGIETNFFSSFPATSDLICIYISNRPWTKTPCDQLVADRYAIQSKTWSWTLAQHFVQSLHHVLVLNNILRFVMLLLLFLIKCLFHLCIWMRGRNKDKKLYMCPKRGGDRHHIVVSQVDTEDSKCLHSRVLSKVQIRIEGPNAGGDAFNTWRSHKWQKPWSDGEYRQTHIVTLRKKVFLKIKQIISVFNKRTAELKGPQSFLQCV